MPFDTVVGGLMADELRARLNWRLELYGLQIRRLAEEGPSVDLADALEEAALSCRALADEVRRAMATEVGRPDEAEAGGRRIRY